MWGELFARPLPSEVPSPTAMSSPRLSLRVLGNPARAETVFEIRPACVDPAGTQAFSHPATVEIFDVRGALVRTLVGRREGAGVTRLAWDGRGAAGARAAAGAYFARARADGFEAAARFYRLR
jgi:hypothetical protein